MKKLILDNTSGEKTGKMTNKFNPIKEKQLKKVLRRLPDESISYDSIEIRDDKVDYFIPGDEK